MIWTRVFRGSCSLLKSMSAPRENTARINKLVLVPGCKWQQTKMGKDLSDLLLQNKQVREVLRQGTENQNTFFFFPQEIWIVTLVKPLC